jgi:hypothetical protein
MTTPNRVARLATVALVLASTACGGSAGGLGNILGGVLGQQQQNQLSGTVAGLDTRTQQIGVRQSNGQTVALSYDNQTRVVYQDRLYNVTSLENGDEIVARIASGNNGTYYTDSVLVTQPVAGSSTTGSTSASAVQTLQGTVRQVDRANGLFTLDAGTNVTLSISLPYNANRADVTKFQNLRAGDYVRLQGVYLNNSRVELRQFY